MRLAMRFDGIAAATLAAALVAGITPGASGQEPRPEPPPRPAPEPPAQEPDPFKAPGGSLIEGASRGSGARLARGSSVSIFFDQDSVLPWLGAWGGDQNYTMGELTVGTCGRRRHERRLPRVGGHPL